MLWCSGDRIILRRLQKACSGEKKSTAGEVCSPIPCVLVAENVADSCVNPLQWIGPGKIFESELALEQFCKDHGIVVSSLVTGDLVRRAFSDKLYLIAFLMIFWRTIKRKTKLGFNDIVQKCLD